MCLKASGGDKGELSQETGAGTVSPGSRAASTPVCCWPGSSVMSFHLSREPGGAGPGEGGTSAQGALAPPLSHSNHKVIIATLYGVLCGRCFTYIS